MHFKFSKNNLYSKDKIIFFIESFNLSGVLFGDGKRNKIKLFNLEGKTINIKSFKIPNLLNKIIYRYFRKSKAKRSFEYANYLLENNIGTPKPIAYFENISMFGLKDSYYVSEHLQCDLTYRELVETVYPDAENILRQFTQFTFSMHEKGIEFLDHSPGNTLIIKTSEGKYDFYLVDLNRMKFHQTMDFETRMKNLSKITPKEDMVAIMSNEYAKLAGIDEDKVFSTMWNLTKDFQYRFYRKKRIKKRLKFWKKQ